MSRALRVARAIIWGATVTVMATALGVAIMLILTALALGAIERFTDWLA